MLGKEPDLPPLDAQAVLFEVDTSLMSLEHVEAEQKIDVSTLEDRETDRKVQVVELDLSRMNATQDFSRADTSSDAREPLVEKAHQTENRRIREEMPVDYGATPLTRTSRRIRD